MLIELLTDIDLLSDADNDPLVLIESLTISEVLIESDVLVETLCDAAMLSDPETEPLVLVESLNDSCLLYTSDAADERSSGGLGVSRII